jgi:hypothetical protein
MSLSLTSVYIFTSRLDAVLAARGDIDAVPFTTPSIGLPFTSGSQNGGGVGGGREKGRKSIVQKVGSFFRGVGTAWDTLMLYITGWLEVWTAPKDDKQIAWTLGIGWACCGGGLAGGCLVFAKATYVSSAQYNFLI